MIENLGTHNGVGEFNGSDKERASNAILGRPKEKNLRRPSPSLMDYIKDERYRRIRRTPSSTLPHKEQPVLGLPRYLTRSCGNLDGLPSLSSLFHFANKCLPLSPCPMLYYVHHRPVC